MKDFIEQLLKNKNCKNLPTRLTSIQQATADRVKKSTTYFIEETRENKARTYNKEKNIFDK